MLIDDALERIVRARAHIELGEDTEKSLLLHSALLIVGQLRSSLDVGRGDVFAVNLDDLYDYVSRQLVSANLHNRVAALDEVSHLLREIRCAWVTMAPAFVARTADMPRWHEGAFAF